jgi:beta-galactosidase
LFRDVIAKATGVTPPDVPAVAPPISVPAFGLEASVSLWKALPRPVDSQQLLTMEDLDQAYGYILYRTKVAEPVRGELVLDQLHDYAQVYANGTLIGTLDRRLEQDRLAIDLKEPNTRLDILVENTGRINFTSAIRDERKGITRQVTLAGKPLTGWQIYSLPMKDPGKLSFAKAACSGPCFYRGSFDIKETGDTFLYTGNFTKGFVWVNGHPLGRVWNIGPQKSLYLPGVWLNKGKNVVIVFDLEGAPGRKLEGRALPVLDENLRRDQ